VRRRKRPLAIGPTDDSDNSRSLPAPIVHLCVPLSPGDIVGIIIGAIAVSPRRHDRRARRSGLGEILRARGLPRDGDVVAAGEWAKGVWRFNVAQQGTSSRTPSLAWTALADPRDHPGLLEFRRLDDLFS
jgi:hypothetical protein